MKLDSSRDRTQGQSSQQVNCSIFGEQYCTRRLEETQVRNTTFRLADYDTVKLDYQYEGWYHNYYFTSGLEITAMMLDYVNYTGDAEFRDRVLVPFGCACWTQDQIHWAYAGDASEAADGLVRRFRIATPMCRFPLYGREGPDSCPDFDHFGAGSAARSAA